MEMKELKNNMKELTHWCPIYDEDPSGDTAGEHGLYRVRAKVEWKVERSVSR